VYSGYCGQPICVPYSRLWLYACYVTRACRRSYLALRAQPCSGPLGSLSQAGDRVRASLRRFASVELSSCALTTLDATRRSERKRELAHSHMRVRTQARTSQSRVPIAGFVQ
jgi:hypothetical protein